MFSQATAMNPGSDDTTQALRLLLITIAGPNYAGALDNGCLDQQIDRCIGWVRAEVSEAVSLIESCVPHGKPMLAQAQKRLENLEAIRTLEKVTTNHFRALECGEAPSTEEKSGASS